MESSRGDPMILSSRTMQVRPTNTLHVGNAVILCSSALDVLVIVLIVHFSCHHLICHHCHSNFHFHWFLLDLVHCSHFHSHLSDCSDVGKPSHQLPNLSFPHSPSWDILVTCDSCLHNSDKNLVQHSLSAPMTHLAAHHFAPSHCGFLCHSQFT